jgi:hypothetical protein
MQHCSLAAEPFDNKLCCVGVPAIPTLRVALPRAWIERMCDEPAVGRVAGDGAYCNAVGSGAV